MVASLSPVPSLSPVSSLSEVAECLAEDAEVKLEDRARIGQKTDMVNPILGFEVIKFADEYKMQVREIAMIALTLINIASGGRPMLNVNQVRADLRVLIGDDKE